MYLMPWSTTAPNGLYCNIKSNVVDAEHKSNTTEMYMSQIEIYDIHLLQNIIHSQE